MKLTFGHTFTLFPKDVIRILPVPLLAMEYVVRWGWLEWSIPIARTD